MKQLLFPQHSTPIPSSEKMTVFVSWRTSCWGLILGVLSKPWDFLQWTFRFENCGSWNLKSRRGNTSLGKTLNQMSTIKNSPTKPTCCEQNHGNVGSFDAYLCQSSDAFWCSEHVCFRLIFESIFLFQKLGGQYNMCIYLPQYERLRQMKLYSSDKARWSNLGFYFHGTNNNRKNKKKMPFWSGMKWVCWSNKGLGNHKHFFVSCKPIGLRTFWCSHLHH